MKLISCIDYSCSALRSHQLIFYIYSCQAYRMWWYLLLLIFALILNFIYLTVLWPNRMLEPLTKQRRSWCYPASCPWLSESVLGQGLLLCYPSFGCILFLSCTEILLQLMSVFDVRCPHELRLTYSFMERLLDITANVNQSLPTDQLMSAGSASVVLFNWLLISRLTLISTTTVSTVYWNMLAKSNFEESWLNF